MNVLEKILEEIKEVEKEYVTGHKVLYALGATGMATEISSIIRSHMDDVPDNNDGWIPVSEKLPERDYETVLCVDEDDYYFVAVYTKEDRFKTEDFGADYENIIAWQLLPELYREDKQDEKI